MKNLTIVLVFGIVSMVRGGLLVSPPRKLSSYDKRLQEMAKLAVKELGSEYKFVRVILGSTQVVNGILYNIELVAKKVIRGDKNQRRRCKVLVYEIKHKGYLELEEFHCHFTKKTPRL